MVFEFFKKNKITEKYQTIYRGQLHSLINPLPQLYPNLYKSAPSDKFANLDQLITEQKKVIADILYTLRLPQGKTLDVLNHNCTQILRIPAIYSLILNLSQRKYKRFLNNTFSLAAVFQACACYGKSEMHTLLLEQMMPILLAIYSRFFAIPYLKEDAFNALLLMRKFNINDSKEKKQRELFFAQLSKQADNLTQESMERFAATLGDCDTNNNSFKGMLHIIRYSSRLMGRTALNLKRNQEQDIHQFASYTGVLYSICSALISTSKRLCIILAEEYERNRVHHKMAGVEKTSRYNIYAITDFLDAHRCQILEFFQGKDEVAIYCEPEHIYVRKISDNEGYKHWACFKVDKIKDSNYERKKNNRKLIHNSRNDPTDQELIPVFSTLPKK